MEFPTTLSCHRKSALISCRYERHDRRRNCTRLNDIPPLHLLHKCTYQHSQSTASKHVPNSPYPRNDAKKQKKIVVPAASIPRRGLQTGVRRRKYLCTPPPIVELLPSLPLSTELKGARCGVAKRDDVPVSFPSLFLFPVFTATKQPTSV